MLAGTLMAMGSGAAFPLMTIIFGSVWISWTGPLINYSLLLRLLDLLMLMLKVGLIQRSRLMSFNLKSIRWHWPLSTFSLELLWRLISRILVGMSNCVKI
jgi:hypothetical protein